MFDIRKRRVHKQTFDSVIFSIKENLRTYFKFGWSSKTFINSRTLNIYVNYQFPLKHVPAGKDGSFIHHLGLPVYFDDLNYHKTLLQACLTLTCKWQFSLVCLTLSFVPTPSAPLTSKGSVKPAALRSKRPPNPPRSAVQPLRAVNAANGLIASTSRLPASISTPASEYVKPLGLYIQQIKPTSVH